MTATLSTQNAALDPLREALNYRAHAEAEHIRTAAEQDGQRVVTEARSRAETLLEGARETGRADAAALLAEERAGARRAARAIILEAKRDSYEEVRRRARLAVAQLLAEPRRRSRLAAALQARLGGDAVVRDHPDGGLVAEAPGGRRIDASVAALVDRAVADLDLEQLWAAS